MTRMLVVVNRRQRQQQQKQKRPSKKIAGQEGLPAAEKEKKKTEGEGKEENAEERQRIKSEDLVAEIRASLRRDDAFKLAPYGKNGLEDLPSYPRYLTVIRTTFEQIRVEVGERRRYVFFFFCPHGIG